MAQNVADFFWSRLHEWGVRCVFGFPGDGINGLLAACSGSATAIPSSSRCGMRRWPPSWPAVMPSSLAKWESASRLPDQARSICSMVFTTPAGPSCRCSPLSASRPRGSIGGSLSAGSRPCHGFQRCGRRVRHRDRLCRSSSALVDRAVRIAVGKTQRAVTCLIIPNDLQEIVRGSAASRTNSTCAPGVGYAAPRILPPRRSPAAGRRRAQRRQEGRHAGRRRRAARDRRGHRSRRQARRRRRQGVARQGRVPDDLPFVTGSIGLLGTKPSWDMMKDCDTFLMVGSAFPYSEFLPKPGRRAACRSTSTAPCSACAIRWRST